MNAQIRQLNAIRKQLIAAFVRAGGDAPSLQEAIDAVSLAIQSLGGTVADVEGY